MMLSLRPARLADAEILWLWANDPGTRAGSGGRPAIPWPKHATWLAERLSSDSARLFIAEDAAGRPVGTIRFETSNGWARARLSYAVAPSCRGRGAGAALLAAGIQAIRFEQPGVVLEAEVHPDNEASLRLFRRLRWPERLTPRGTMLFQGLAGDEA